MSDQFGFLEGVKSVTGSMDASRQASKSITKSITDVQKDAVDVAQQRLNERRREQYVHADSTIVSAVNEWERLLRAKQTEEQLQRDIIRQHGKTAWTEIQQIKQRQLKEKENDKKFFSEEVNKVKRVMVICYIVAAWIAWYLTWGIKK
jgi:uncharacterized protein YaiL (DUF2058 family)